MYLFVLRLRRLSLQMYPFAIDKWPYQKITPMQQIEFINNFADKDAKQIDPTTMGLPSDIPQDVRHGITFKSVGNNMTEMTVTDYGYTSDQTHDLSKAGLEQCLDKMVACLK